MVAVFIVVAAVFMAALTIAWATDRNDRRTGRQQRKMQSLASYGRTQRRNGKARREQMQRGYRAPGQRMDRR